MIINKGTIALGVLLGAAVGVLLAPDKGSKTRQKLKEEAVRIKNAQPSSADPDKFDFRLFLKEFTEEIQGSAGKGPASKAVQKSKQSQNSNKK